jgi:hypothetical protein
VTILFWGDSFVPILRDLASRAVPEAVRSDTQTNVMDALYNALSRNNIPITPLEDFIAADSAPFRSQAIAFEIVVVYRQP